MKIFECEESCLFIQNLYQKNSPTFSGYLIPQPLNLVAIERKSRRTVRLKWNIDQSIDTEPIFYVIEAQWMKGKSNENNYQIISKWGFVREEVSNQKSIIRNIQRDHRWYRFRVTSVTRHGYSNTSETSQPVRLSRN